MPINIEALLKPIPGSDPCGLDLRYQPVTLAIKEARREDADVSQGVWKTDIKVADFPQVVKLSRDALTKQGKDLQVAAFLTEALLRTEGFGGLRQGLELIRRLLETYWDGVHPRPDEDGDLEMRSTALRWVGSQLDVSVRFAPITKSGHTWYQYRESRSIPTDEESKMDAAKLARRNEAIQDRKTTPEDFQNGFDATPGQWSLELYRSIRALIEQINELGQFCDEKFGDSAPEFSSLRSSLEEVFQTARVLMKQKGVEDKEPEEEEEAQPEAPAASEPVYAQPTVQASAPPPVAAPAAPPPPRPAPAPAPAAAMTSGAEPASREDAVQRILAAARYLRKENPYNPGGYMVTRGLRWGELRSTGNRAHPAILVSPPTEVRVGLKQLAAEGVWQKTLEAAEEAAGQPWGRAWLDVHRYSVTALQSANIEAAAKAILSGVKSLLADMPFLLEWTLADDTPVANAETVQWLKDQGALDAPEPESQFEPPPLPPEPEPPPPPAWIPPPPVVMERRTEGTEGEPPPPDPYELAMEAARSGRVDEAFAILSREVNQEQSGRGRFQRRVQLAQLCLATGNREIGKPILQELAEEVLRRSLEQWENPEMIAQPLALLYRCMDDNVEGSEKRSLYGRICRLDPTKALGLR